MRSRVRPELPQVQMPATGKAEIDTSAGAVLTDRTMLDEAKPGPSAFQGPAGEEDPQAVENLPFGEFLARERGLRQLSLDEAALHALIPVRYLEALENEKYGDLPPKPYVKGFLNAYARYLGIDQEEISTRFESGLREYTRHRREEGKGAVFALFHPRGESYSLRDWAIPLSLAVLAALFLLGKVFFPPNPVRDVTAPAPPLEGPPGVVSPSLPQMAAETEMALPDEPALSSASAGVRLLLAAEASTWVAARRDGGETEEWTLRRGDARELRAVKEILLSLGNAGAVRITYNEREMGFIGQKGQVKRDLVFTAPDE